MISQPTEPKFAAHEQTVRETTDWLALIHELGPKFATRAAVHDAEDTFVADNYAELKAHRFFSAGVPLELGGGGVSHSEMCRLLRTLAHHCPATALTLSMHQHLVAANVWKYLHGQPGEAALRRVAEQELVLVSTGARDWLASNGEAERVEGGYRINAKKAFASGCQAGNVLVTSAPYHDPEAGASVLHFSVPLSAEGVTINEDWRVLGMRGTGSHTAVLNGVFVPEAAIVLQRPQGEWHPVWNVILGVAMPLIMSVYVGVAEAAAELAIREVKTQNDSHLPYLVGELTTRLVTAQLALKDMVALTNDYNFKPTLGAANEILIRKTVAANASLATVEKALETVGGRGFYRKGRLERLLRDVHGAQFHPLPEKEQQYLSGQLALGREPGTV